MRLVFFGASKFVVPVIQLLNDHHELELVVTTEKQMSDQVPKFCFKSNIPFISISKTDSKAAAKIKGVKARMAVLAYFGILLPGNILGQFPLGILNIHPSLLPKYRGATPVQSSILNGDGTTGVTIIKLDGEMDHGPILSQIKEKINPMDTTESLHKKLFEKGAEMLIRDIPKYTQGDLTLYEQEHLQATYTKRSFNRQDGFIDAAQLPSKQELDRMIRALYPWPGVWTKILLNKNKWKILKLLPERTLQIEGKKPMGVKDFLNGYPELKETVDKFY